MRNEDLGDCIYGKRRAKGYSFINGNLRKKRIN